MRMLVSNKGSSRSVWWAPQGEGMTKLEPKKISLFPKIRNSKTCEKTHKLSQIQDIRLSLIILWALWWCLSPQRHHGHTSNWTSSLRHYLTHTTITNQCTTTCVIDLAHTIIIVWVVVTMHDSIEYCFIVVVGLSNLCVITLSLLRAASLEELCNKVKKTFCREKSSKVFRHCYIIIPNILLKSTKENWADQMDPRFTMVHRSSYNQRCKKHIP